jgi:hypothetical protein
LNDEDRALDNFETSYFLIQKSGDNTVNDLIAAKICSNIGVISGNKGFLNDCLKFHERSLTFKGKIFP